MKKLKRMYKKLCQKIFGKYYYKTVVIYCDIKGPFSCDYVARRIEHVLEKRLKIPICYHKNTLYVDSKYQNIEIIFCTYLDYYYGNVDITLLGGDVVDTICIYKPKKAFKKLFKK